MKYSNSDNQEIYYKKIGEGEHNLILLHGWLNNHTVWLNEIQALKENYTSYLLDLRGHGESYKPEGKEAYTLEEFAQDIDDLITQENIETYTLVGYSMGGMISLYHESKRQSADSLVLIDTSLDPGMEMFRNKYGETILDFIEMINTKGYLEPEDVDLTNTYPSLNWLSGLRNTSINITGFCLDMMLHLDLQDEIEEISIPTLIIHGENDNIIPVEHGKEISNHIEQGKLMTLDKGNHFSILKTPQEISLHIKQFLDEIN